MTQPVLPAATSTPRREPAEVRVGGKALRAIPVTREDYTDENELMPPKWVGWRIDYKGRTFYGVTPAAAGIELLAELGPVL